MGFGLGSPSSYRTWQGDITKTIGEDCAAYLQSSLNMLLSGTQKLEIPLTHLTDRKEISALVNEEIEKYLRVLIPELQEIQHRELSARIGMDDGIPQGKMYYTSRMDFTDAVGAPRTFFASYRLDVEGDQQLLSLIAMREQEPEYRDPYGVYNLEDSSGCDTRIVFAKLDIAVKQRDAIRHHRLKIYQARLGRTQKIWEGTPHTYDPVLSFAELESVPKRVLFKCYDVDEIRIAIHKMPRSYSELLDSISTSLVHRPSEGILARTAAALTQLPMSVCDVYYDTKLKKPTWGV